MKFLERILRPIVDRSPRYTPRELRAVFDRYSSEWPSNNTEYAGWKPRSLLPANPDMVRQAIKLCYAEWPGVIDWTVYSAFHMEYVDLAAHISDDDYSLITRFRKGRVMECGKLSTRDPLLMHTPISNLMVSMPPEQHIEDIKRYRESLRRSSAWDPIDVNDYTLESIRRIVVTSRAEMASLDCEWKFYIASIGRDDYTAE